MTTIDTSEDGEPKLLTARNDSLLNSFNPVQLSGWRANVDMQYVVLRGRVIKYIATYATEPEPHSKGLKIFFKTVMNRHKDDGKTLKVAQKLLINSVGERDYLAQETCHLILGIPMFSASRNFVYLSLDGSWEVADRLDEGTSCDRGLTARPLLCTSQYSSL